MDRVDSKKIHERSQRSHSWIHTSVQWCIHTVFIIKNKAFVAVLAVSSSQVRLRVVIGWAELGAPSSTGRHCRRRRRGDLEDKAPPPQQRDSCRPILVGTLARPVALDSRPDAEFDDTLASPGTRLDTARLGPVVIVLVLGSYYYGGRRRHRGVRSRGLYCCCCWW